MAPAGRRAGGAEPWTNPFGVFYTGKQGAAFAEAGVTLRVMAHQERWESADGPRHYDEAVLRGRGADGAMVTLMPHARSRQREGVEAVGFHRYCLPEGEELSRAMRFVRQVVERYDGDEDFGCVLGPGPDCYARGDGKYPRDPDALRARPLKIWQFENEPFYQLVDCASGDTEASGPKLVAYFEAGAAAMRAADSSATLVFPAVTGFRAPLMDRGLVDTLDVGWGDCAHRRLTRTELEARPEAMAEDRASARRARERLEYVLSRGTSSYDAIDFHSYSNDVYEVRALGHWLAALGVGDLPIVSTEMAGPFYMFVEMGAPRPGRCAAGGRDDRGPGRYDDALLSEYVVKKHVVCLAAGVKRLHWATGEELFDPYLDNYQRLGLVEKDGRRKPAYFTYRLLIDKLLGFRGPVERPFDDVYVFQHAGKGPTVVVWGRGRAAPLDLSSTLQTPRARVTRIVVALDASGGPLVAPVETVPAARVPVASTPVFVEEEP